MPSRLGRLGCWIFSLVAFAEHDQQSFEHPANTKNGAAIGAVRKLGGRVFKPPFPFEPAYQLADPLATDTQLFGERRLRNRDGCVDEIAPANVVETTRQIVQDALRFVRFNPRGSFDREN